VIVAHRDDQEAARHRIAALERELEDTRRRAETAEAEARRVREAPPPVVQRREPPSKAEKREKKKRRGARAEAPTSDPRWPPGGLDRYRKLAGASVIVYAPAALALATSVSSDALPFAMLGIALLAQLVIVYVIGRACRAPFPWNGSLVLLISTPIVLCGLYLGASDMLWSGLLPSGILSVVVRTACALVVLAVGALVSGAWTADAASSDVSSN
jgi:hypothetical protein